MKSLMFVLLFSVAFKLVVKIGEKMENSQKRKNTAGAYKKQEFKSENPLPAVSANAEVMQKKDELNIFELNYKFDKAISDIEHYELVLHELNNELRQAAGPKTEQALQKKIYTAECKLDKAYHDRELARLKLYNMGAQT